MKKPDDALNAERMNVKDGGKQPFMRDTVWNGDHQSMVTDDGVQKGMRTVLEERGVDTKGMNAEKMREELLKFEVNLNKEIKESYRITKYHPPHSAMQYYRTSMIERQSFDRRSQDGDISVCTYPSSTVN